MNPVPVSSSRSRRCLVIPEINLVHQIAGFLVRSARHPPYDSPGTRVIELHEPRPRPTDLAVDANRAVPVRRSALQRRPEFRCHAPVIDAVAPVLTSSRSARHQVGAVRNRKPRPVTRRPCLTCGALPSGSRCPRHQFAPTRHGHGAHSAQRSSARRAPLQECGKPATPVDTGCHSPAADPTPARTSELSAPRATSRRATDDGGPSIDSTHRMRTCRNSRVFPPASRLDSERVGTSKGARGSWASSPALSSGRGRVEMLVGRPQERTGAWFPDAEGSRLRARPATPTNTAKTRCSSVRGHGRSLE